MKFALLSKVGAKVSKMTGRTGLKIREKSPEILLVTGMVGFVATTVLACKATLEIEDVLDEHKEMMDKIHDGEENIEEYSNDAASRDKFRAYCKTGWKFARLYAPAITVGAFSITCILVSNNIRKKRYAAVVAAYTTVSTAFDKYRERVREDGGEELDRKYMFGTHTEKEEYTEVDEKGRKHKKKKDVEVMDDGNGKPSGYARVFDSDNPNWSENPSFSMSFLRAQENLLNNKLQTCGHVFLNEVYEELGFEHTQEGAVVGWMLGSKHGDDVIDFGLYNLHKEPVRRFINGEENVILLDFNVDGVIFDKI